MSAFKYEASAGDYELTAELIESSRPAFELFDPRFEGGLGILPNGQVFEVRHPSWVNEESENYLARTSLLPVWAQLDGSQVFGFEVRLAEFDPDRPTLGGEFEVAPTHKKEQWKISEDGKEVRFPDGSTGLLSDFGLDPEALQAMTEFKTDVARGFEDYRRQVIEVTERIDQLFESHGLSHAGLAMFPEDFHREDASKLAFIVNILDRMNAREFGVMSDQLHVQMLDPDAALHALNVYQAVQAVFGLVTSAAPIRDGSFDTTIGEHYRMDVSTAEKVAEAERTGDYMAPDLPMGEFGRMFKNRTPYDWRELGRVLGSPSSGAYSEAAPDNIYSLLQLADSRLRDGSIVSSVRALGWHTDRFRLDKGTVEINNMGTAGGNLRKVLAAHEAVSKFIVALQLQYMEMSHEQRTQARIEHQTAVEVAHFNNISIAIEGKNPYLLLRDHRGKLQTPSQMLSYVLAFTQNYADRYGFTPISETAQAELAASLSCEQPDYKTVGETLEAFFMPYSPMTATDALRHAHNLSPRTTTKTMLGRHSRARRAHVRSMYEATTARQPLPRQRIGETVLAAAS